MSYLMRDFRGEGDLEPIMALIAACQAVDHLDRPATKQGLHEEFLEPTSGWGRAIALWTTETADDDLMAVANIWVPRRPKSRTSISGLSSIPPPVRVGSLTTSSHGATTRGRHSPDPTRR
jgi:hypothetical protein